MQDGLHLGIGTRRVVVKEQHAAGARLRRELERVLERGVPERTPLGQFVGRVLRVVHEHVDIAGQIQRILVQRAEALGPGTAVLWRVIGQVRQGACAVADAEAECLAALVRDLAHKYIKAFEAVVAPIDHAERPIAPQLMRPDGEMRRRHRAGQQLDGLDTLGGQQQVRARVGTVAGGEERQPVGVIPMQMAEQDRAPKRRAVEDTGQVA